MANTELSRQGFMAQRDNALADASTSATSIVPVDAQDVVFPAEPARTDESTGNVVIEGTWGEDSDLDVVVEIGDLDGTNRRLSVEQRTVGNGTLEDLSVDPSTQVQVIRMRLIDTGIDTERATAYFDGVPIEVTDDYLGDVGNNIRIEVDTSNLVIGNAIASTPEDASVDQDLFEERAWQFGDIYPLSTSGLMHPNSQRITFDTRANEVYRRYIERDRSKTVVRLTPPLVDDVVADTPIYPVTGDYTVKVIYEEFDGNGDPVPGTYDEEVFTGITVFDIVSLFLSSQYVRPAVQLVKNRRPGGIGALDVTQRSNQQIAKVTYSGEAEWPGDLASANPKALETELITLTCTYIPAINQERWSIIGKVSGDLGVAVTGTLKETEPLDFTIPAVGIVRVSVETPPQVINANYAKGGVIDIGEPTIDPETEEEIPAEEVLVTGKGPDICLYKWALGPSAKSDTLTFTYVLPRGGLGGETEAYCDCRNGEVDGSIDGGSDVEVNDRSDASVMTDTDYASRIKDLSLLEEGYIHGQQNDNLAGNPYGDPNDILFIKEVIRTMVTGLKIIVDNTELGDPDRTSGLASWDGEYTRIQAAGDGTLSNLGSFSYTTSVTDPNNYYFETPNNKVGLNDSYRLSISGGMNGFSFYITSFSDDPQFSFYVTSDYSPPPGGGSETLVITKSEFNSWVSQLVTNTTTGAGVGDGETFSLTTYDSLGSPVGSPSAFITYLGATPPTVVRTGVSGQEIETAADLTLARQTVLERVMAGMRQAIAAANIDPFDSAVLTEGDGEMNLSQPHWRVTGSDGRVYVEMMSVTADDPVGRPFKSRVREFDKEGNQIVIETNEWTLQFRGDCLDLLTAGDSFQVPLKTLGSENAYKVGDKIFIRTLSYRPLPLQGGVDGDNLHTWVFLSEDAINRPPYQVENGNEQSYATLVGASAGGIDVLARRGSIPNQLNDEWLLYIQGGQYRASIDGGDTFGSYTDIPSTPAALTGGLSLSFEDGPRVSFEDGDLFSYSVKQPNKSFNATLPNESAWRPQAGAQSITFDMGQDIDIDSIALLRYDIPDGRTVTITLLDALDAVLYTAPVFTSTGDRSGFYHSLSGVVTASKVNLAVDDGDGVEIAWVWAGELLQLSVDASNVTLRHERVMARASGPNAAALPIGIGHSARVEWSYASGEAGPLGVDDDAKARALYRALTLAGNGWVGFVPNITRNQALLTRWSEDTLDIEDDLGYNADPDQVEKRQMTIALQGVLG